MQIVLEMLRFTGLKEPSSNRALKFSVPDGLTQKARSGPVQRHHPEYVPLSLMGLHIAVSEDSKGMRPDLNHRGLMRPE